MELKNISQMGKRFATKREFLSLSLSQKTLAALGPLILIKSLNISQTSIWREWVILGLFTLLLFTIVWS